jgi:hypothetical protein
MPLSELQARVLQTLAANRSPDSYVAGATLVNRAEDSPRYSQDLDFFHDVADSVAQSAEQDAATLLKEGYAFTWLLRTPTFYRAVVTVEQEALKLEWAQDSAFRFFPVQPDDRFGYRLHDGDAATNKVLALAGRSEIRDFIDALHLHQTCLSLGAMVWAACGKDLGFTPEFLLDQAGRHTAYTQGDLDRLRLREPLDLKLLKQRWLAAREEAFKLVAELPPAELGCLYLRSDGNPVSPEPASASFAALRRHWGRVGGAWPTVSPYPAGA